jgi:hypothetical protein
MTSYYNCVRHRVTERQSSPFGNQSIVGLWVVPQFEIAFSKKIQNHAAMVAIHAVHYNYARIHKTLRITPSMAAGLSDHVWSLEEIVMMADSYLPKPGKRGPYTKAN